MIRIERGDGEEREIDDKPEVGMTPQDDQEARHSSCRRNRSKQQAAEQRSERWIAHKGCALMELPLDNAP